MALRLAKKHRAFVVTHPASTRRHFNPYSPGSGQGHPSIQSQSSYFTVELRDEHQAEANVAAAVGGAVEVAKSRPAALRTDVPATAADNTGRTGFRTCRISNPSLRFAFVVEFFIVPVTAPFPYIAVHVVQAEGVGLKSINFYGILSKYSFFVFIIGIISVLVCLVGSQVCAGKKRRGRAGPAGVFPFCFCGQAECSSLEFPVSFVQPGAISNSIVPAYMNHGVVVFAFGAFFARDAATPIHTFLEHPFFAIPYIRAAAFFGISLCSPLPPQIF